MVWFSFPRKTKWQSSANQQAATKEFVKLPKGSDSIPSIHKSRVGFGFEPCSNKYKAARFFYENETGNETSHSVAFYRCPNTLSPIWSTDAHVVAGAEMKKKWPPMHVRSPVLQTLKNIIPRSPLPPRPLRRCVTGSTSTVKHRCPRCENWRAEASVLGVRLKFFSAPLTLWTV